MLYLHYLAAELLDKQTDLWPGQCTGKANTHTHRHTHLQLSLWPHFPIVLLGRLHRINGDLFCLVFRWILSIGWKNSWLFWEKKERKYFILKHWLKFSSPLRNKHLFEGNLQCSISNLIVGPSYIYRTVYQISSPYSYMPVVLGGGRSWRLFENLHAWILCFS